MPVGSGEIRMRLSPAAKALGGHGIGRFESAFVIRRVARESMKRSVAACGEICFRILRHLRSHRSLL